MRENEATDGFSEVSSALRDSVVIYRQDFDGERQEMMGDLETILREGAEFVDSLTGRVKYSYNLAAVFCKALDPDVNTADDPANFWSEQVI